MQAVTTWPWRAYWQLARMDKPIGTLLLLWPTLWSLWLASAGSPPLWPLLAMGLGVVLMRAAGCVINDYADRQVDGYSIGVPTTPSMFDTLHLEDKICQHYGDIRNKREFNDFVQEVKPDFLIHLAAQALVLTSYREPFETMTTNIVGTAVVCEAVMNIDWNCTCVLITSDKAYDNVEWIWGYRETDGIGGKDIYSGSKGAAELVIKSYWHSFIKKMPNIKFGVARAGNVIGGGDWAKDRIIVDCVKAFSEGKTVEIRSPKELIKNGN